VHDSRVDAAQVQGTTFRCSLNLFEGKMLHQVIA